MGKTEFVFLSQNGNEERYLRLPSTELGQTSSIASAPVGGDSVGDNNKRRKICYMEDDAKNLRITVNKLQQEKAFRKEMNRQNSQKFRDRKKDYMQNLFDEKYRLGEENIKLRDEYSRIKGMLDEAKAENKRHRDLQNQNQYGSCLLVANNFPYFSPPLLLPPCLPVVRGSQMFPYSSSASTFPTEMMFMGNMKAQHATAELAYGAALQCDLLHQPGISPTYVSPRGPTVQLNNILQNESVMLRGCINNPQRMTNLNGLEPVKSSSIAPSPDDSSGESTTEEDNPELHENPDYIQSA